MDRLSKQLKLGLLPTIRAPWSDDFKITLLKECFLSSDEETYHASSPVHGRICQSMRG